MKKNLLKTKMLIITLAAAFAFIGCASVPLTKSMMSNEPVQVISKVNTTSAKVGVLTNTVHLGFIGNDKTFPSIAETARSGDITRIATVEYYKRNGIFRLWTEYTTIVTGQ